MTGAVSKVEGTSDQSLEVAAATPGRRFPVALGLISVVFYAWASIARHRAMSTGFDLTIFDQLMQKYSRFQEPLILVKSRAEFNILGDHFSPVLWLVSPFYRVWPNAAVLLVAQAALFGLAAMLMARYAQRLLGRAGMFVAACFALSWGVLQAVSFDFHEIAFTTPLLILAINALQRGRWTSFYLLTGLLLLTKEDTPLLVLGFALCLLVQKQYRHAAACAAGAVVYFCVVVFWVIPSFSASGSYTYLSYAQDDSGAVSGAVSHVIDNLTSAQGLTFLVLIVLTLGIGVRSPLALILVPTVGARFVSSHTSYLSQDFHYNATLMVICFMALTSVLATRIRRGGREVFALPERPFDRRSFGVDHVQAVVLALVTFFSVTSAPTVTSVVHSFDRCSRCEDFDALAERLPPGSDVITDIFLGPQLVDEHGVLMATPDWKDALGHRLEAPWVLLDLETIAFDNPDVRWVRTNLESLTTSGQYRIVDRSGPFVLLRSTGTAAGLGS